MPESRLILIIKISQLLIGATGLALLILGGIQLYQGLSFKTPIISLGLGLFFFVLSLMIELIIFDNKLLWRSIYGVIIIGITVLSALILNDPSMLKMKILALMSASAFTLWTRYLISKKGSRIILQIINTAPLAFFIIAVLFNLSNGWFWLLIAFLIPIYLIVGIISIYGKAGSIDKSPETVDTL